MIHELIDIHIHGFSLVVFIQHLFFDSIAAAGGWYARKFCSHMWHKVVVVTLFTLVSTLLLVTLVG